MALKTKVKLSGVNNLSDARYGAGMGVYFMGFNLDPESPDHLTPEQYDEITGWITGVVRVGEFETSNSTSIKLALANNDVDMIQVRNEALIEELSDTGKEVLLRVNSVNASSNFFDRNMDKVHAFLIDGSIPSGQINILSTQYPVLVEGLITPEACTELLNNTSIMGFSLQGSNELKPGIANLDQIADVLESLEIEDWH